MNKQYIPPFIIKELSRLGQMGFYGEFKIKFSEGLIVGADVTWKRKTKDDGSDFIPLNFDVVEDAKD